jgi:hypothetical protein
MDKEITRLFAVVHVLPAPEKRYVVQALKDLLNRMVPALTGHPRARTRYSDDLASGA